MPNFYAFKLGVECIGRANEFLRDEFQIVIDFCWEGLWCAYLSKPQIVRMCGNTYLKNIGLFCGAKTGRTRTGFLNYMSQGQKSIVLPKRCCHLPSF